MDHLNTEGSGIKPNYNIHILRMIQGMRNPGLLKCQTMKQPKLTQPDKVLYKWFTAMYFKGKPISRLITFEKAKSLLMKWKYLTIVHSLMSGCEI
jgi:hypothetical protein